MENENYEIVVRREIAKIFPTGFLAEILQEKGFLEVQVLTFTSEEAPSSFDQAVQLIREAIEQVPEEPKYHFVWRLRECIPIVIGSRITAAFEA